MAIDTARKRWSMLSFGRSGFTLPVADGSFDQGDRQHLLGLYSGILVAAEEEETHPTIFLTGNAQRNLAVSSISQRNVAATGNAQRNVGLTGDAGSNAL